MGFKEQLRFGLLGWRFCVFGGFLVSYQSLTHEELLVEVVSLFQWLDIPKFLPNDT